MKESVTITLILVGAALILAPLVSAQLYEARLAQLIATPNTSAILHRGIGEFYSWGCMLIGAAVIWTAVKRSSAGVRAEDAPLTERSPA
jgi:short subunit fatty acids transporter